MIAGRITVGATVGSAALAANVLFAASQAAAVPGDPDNGCETHSLSDICDGPVREDNTFQRCRTPRKTNLNLPVPAKQKCWIVDLNDPAPNFLHGPPNHID